MNSPKNKINLKILKINYKNIKKYINNYKIKKFKKFNSLTRKIIIWNIKYINFINLNHHHKDITPTLIPDRDPLHPRLINSQILLSHPKINQLPPTPIKIEEPTAQPTIPHTKQHPSTPCIYLHNTANKCKESSTPSVVYKNV
jgi:hypothetical protein